MVHIYCGDGKGKTTAATGLTVRALGSGKRVLFAQFFKNGESSEIKLLKTLPNLDYMKAQTVARRVALMNDAQKEEANEAYHELLEAIIAAAPAYDLVVLDEAVSCYQYGYLDKNALLQFCKQGDGPEIVLTGRNPDAALVEVADYCSEVKKLKHPYDFGIPARKGIEY